MYHFIGNNNNEQPPQMPPRKTPSPGVQHSTAADTGSEGMGELVVSGTA